MFRFPIFILLFLASVHVHAQLVRGTMQGVIAESAVTSGDGDTVFGLNGNDLLGRSFWINFYYRTDIAPVSSADLGSGGRVIYGPSNGGADWLGMSLTVNDVTYQMPGTIRYADVNDVADPQDADTDRVQLTVGDEFVSTDGNSFRRQFLETSVSLDNSVLNTPLLPMELASNDIIRVFNSASFRINEFDLDPVTGALVYERYVDFNLDIRSIQATAVPVPSAVWLFSFGSALLMTVGRIRLDEAGVVSTS